MNWTFFKSNKPSPEMVLADERQMLLSELRKAHGDWVHARHRLDWVVDKDQIDYAIYALEAAEKKYEMLLRQAKHFSWTIHHVAKGEQASS